MAKSSFSCAIAIATVAACSAQPPLDWDAAVTANGGPRPGRLVIERGAATFTSDTGTLVAPSMPGACAGSARVALVGGGGAERYVAWWAPRNDSSTALVLARSVDGGVSWSAPEPVDTADHSLTGCKRPAPAIVADSASGYVHVAYAMRDAQGAGVFFSHSMARGQMFHAPVTIVYGERLVDVAIAARGDTVAVVYVDPSADHPPLGLALSHTMGHIFEQRLSVPATTDAGEPAIAIAPGKLAVGWVRRANGGAGAIITRVARFARVAW